MSLNVRHWSVPSILNFLQKCLPRRGKTVLLAPVHLQCLDRADTKALQVRHSINDHVKIKIKTHPAKWSTKDLADTKALLVKVLQPVVEDIRARPVKECLTSRRQLPNWTRTHPNFVIANLLKLLRVADHSLVATVISKTFSCAFQTWRVARLKLARELALRRTCRVVASQIFPRPKVLTNSFCHKTITALHSTVLSKSSLTQLLRTKKFSECSSVSATTQRVGNRSFSRTTVTKLNPV